MLMLRKVLAGDGCVLKLAGVLAGLVLAFGGGGAWGADGDNIVLESGDSPVTIDNNTGVWNWSNPGTDGAPTSDSEVGNYTVSGGNLTVGSTNALGYLEVGRFQVTDGEVTVGGKVNETGIAWTTQTSFITGGWQGINADETTENASVSLTGGTIKLLDGGRIQTTAQGPDVTGNEPRYSGLFHIGGDVEINMEGSSLANAAVLKAHEYHGARDQGNPTGKDGWYTRMLIDGDAKVQIGQNKHGVILSRDTTMNGGAIKVESGGTLRVQGGWGEGASFIERGINHPDIDSWGDFNINGGKITNDGVIDFVTGDMTLNATGGTHTGNMYIQNTIETTPAAGTYSKNLNVSGGMFTVEGNLAVGNNGVLNNTNGSLDVTGTAMLGGTSNLGGTNRFRGASTVSGNLTMAANSTLWLGKTMALSGNLKLASSTKLIWDGTDRYVISNNNASGITFSDSTTLGAYLARQTVSNLIESTVFGRDSGGVFATVNNNPNPVGAMAGILNQTGTGHMAAGLSPSVAGTWAGIMTNNKGTAVEGILKNHLNTNTSSGEAQSVVSTLAGFDSAKSLDISMATANSITGRINSRVADNNLARAQSSGSGFSSRGAFAAPRYGHNVNSFANRFWMGGFGLWEDADKRGFDNGYKYQSGGIIAGYDRVIGDFTAGASYAYTQGDYEDKNALSSNSEIASYALTLYGTYNHATGLFATGMFGYTYSDYDLDNLVTRAGDWDKSSFHANTFTLGGNIGYDIRPTETFSITPSLGLYYYTSASNTFNTSIRHNMRVEQDSFEMPIDVSVNYDIPAGGDSVVRLTANGGYSHDFSWDGGDLDGFGYNGVAGSRISGIKGREVARHTWNVGAGAKYTSGALDVGVKYDYYTKSDYDAHRVMGTVGMSF